MEVDARARCWVATFQWSDAVMPTEDVIPTLPYKLAHAKFAKANDSVSIWFTFDNQVRASTITNALDRDHVVIKRMNAARDLQPFQELPFDWQLVMTKRDEPLSGPLVPQHTNANSSIAASVSETRDIPSPPALGPALLADYELYINTRKRLRALDEELGTIAKRLRPFATEMQGVVNDIIDM